MPPSSTRRPRWDGGRLISRTTTGLLLATIQITTSELRGLPPAHQVLTNAGTIRSVRIRRQWVLPLVKSLQARRGSDYADLAPAGRQDPGVSTPSRSRH